METNHVDPQLIKTIPLMSSKEKLKCGKVKAVLRYHVPNAHRNAEEYSHNLRFSFYPFRHEGESKYPPVSGTYLLKFQQPGVLDVVNRNRHHGILQWHCWRCFGKPLWKYKNYVRKNIIYIKYKEKYNMMKLMMNWLKLFKLSWTVMAQHKMQWYYKMNIRGNV